MSANRNAKRLIQSVSGKRVKSVAVVNPRNKNLPKCEPAPGFFMSTDYSKFKPLPFNRKVEKVRKALAESITDNGFLGAGIVIQASFIDGTEQFYVIDGQHRLSEAQKVNAPFVFQLIEVENNENLIKLVSDLNSSNKNWNAKQFINGYAICKREAYMIVQKVIEETKFGATTVLMAYCGVTSNSKEVRDGSLKIHNRKEGDNLIKQLLDYRHVYNGELDRRALLKVMRMPEYKHKEAVQWVTNKYNTDPLSIPKKETEIKEVFQTMMRFF